MEMSPQNLALLEIETFAHELQLRIGRELTRQERFYLTIMSACAREGRAIPDSVFKQQGRPS
jgi:hypothetical protein